MPEDELMRKWLWMQAMEYALTTLKGRYKEDLYPTRKYNEWQHIGWTAVRKNIFQHVLDHWETLESQGQYSGHSQYNTGCDLYMRSTGVKGTYKTYEIEILWPEVKQFIKKLLSPDIEGRQITLFELLAEEARK